MRKVLVILGQLSDSDVEWLAQAGTREKVAAGRVLIEEGRPISSLYILLDGHMAVSLKGIGTVATLSSGEIMGEMSMIDSRPPSASITAQDDCLVLALSREALQQKLDTDVAFAARFYRAIATFLSDRLRGTVQRLGYGDSGASLDEDVELEGELDLNVLDNVHLAGARFERMLKTLGGSR
ncbi:cyclic nucleotide-binding domain-containing protein [Magnetospirillum moscoviense]|uniref:Cyclic nucleotide-binding protein n=1 Tax=Magnetospirillum moscoviense TaxID=1437059 RepID=A0A178MSI8_9PROT|nr:cyclic nucleotide-binding domain-containing protein [Magnetospirillum moscoviense]OAN52813.1 cyclic nucleotide-binding protein [Magnetospirillum moscoviense]